MKATLTILLLSLSSAAWAKDLPKIPSEKDSKMDKGVAMCMERCQTPITRCMGRCKGDSACITDCKPEKMAQCAEKCGLVKKQKK